MNSPETGIPYGQFVDRVGIAVLLVVAIGAMLIEAFFALWWAGIDHTLHTYALVETFDPETGGRSVVPRRAEID
ncbi:MAG: hypothetical protein F4X26_08760 [Chloroflexi bacterium]|nr:hypothetical protein [Chloroflexota bacterium]